MTRDQHASCDTHSELALNPPQPITSDTECVQRLHAAGHTFTLGMCGGVTITHPVAQPDPREMDAITAYLSRKWIEVIAEVRRQLTTGTSCLGSPAPARTPRAG